MENNERENILRFYRHEKPYHLPDFDKGMHIGFPINGFNERPPFNKGGEDWFGVDWVYEKRANAPVPNHKKPPVLKDIRQWRKEINIPDVNAWDWGKAVALDEVDKIDRDKKVYNVMIAVGLFERLHALMGFQKALIALIENQKEVMDFFEVIMEYKCKLIEKIIRYYKPDIIEFHDDWGTQESMFFSPEIWRKMFKFQMRKAVGICHKNGVLFEMHSCGKIEKIIPDFIEIGIDSWQGMSINNVPELMEKTGNRLAYVMSLNNQYYESQAMIDQLTEEKLRENVKDMILRYGGKGNYAPFVFSADTWWNSIIMKEIAECRRQLGEFS